MTFTEKLQRSVESSKSTLCVGLDPDISKIPSPLKARIQNDADLITEFCRIIIETTKPHVCAFKPNLAFFEALGSEGWRAFEQVLDFIPSNRVVIADAKRGDIGNTAGKYKEAFFDKYGVDAITLNPLMGFDTLSPFMADPGKAVFVLTLTSNAGASDFLKRRFEGRMSLSEYIAEELSKVQSVSKSHLGMVVGATQASELKPILDAHPSSHLLIPGMGSQGGNLQALEHVLKNHQGIPIVNSSRSILYAGGDSETWVDDVLNKTILTKESLNKITSAYV